MSEEAPSNAAEDPPIAAVDTDDQVLAVPHVAHGPDDIAYHVPWGFRRDAMVWHGDVPVAFNFYPVGTKLHAWLLRKESLPVLSESDRSNAKAISNPYAYHSSTLALMLSFVVNDAHALATSDDQIEPLEAEVVRIRSFSEQALYSVRVCEALIKQLLYCTQIPESYYGRAALGSLLSTECRGCKSSGNKRHKISLLGSLAHRYHLCLPFEKCLMKHLSLAGQRRNTEAAHSTAAALNIRTAQESRAQLMHDSEELGNDLVHMLSHLKDLESQMERELEQAAAACAFERLQRDTQVVDG